MKDVAAKFFPAGRTAWFLFCLGVLFQISVVCFFYINLYPDIQRLMPDDALYYMQISRNIAEGHGSVFSPGEPTNGYHPLWMSLLVIVQLLTRSGKEFFIFIILLISVLLNGATALLLKRFLFRIGFHENQQKLGMVLYLFLPWLVLLNLSGLETPLFFMCLIFFFIMIHRVISSKTNQLREYLLLGVSAGLLFLARTDSVFFILAGTAIILWSKKTLLVLRNLLLSGLVTTLLSIPWMLWCWTRFGSPVQSSGMALSYFRWQSMYPVDTLKYWVYNAGRLFHKLAIIFFSPFVYHADNFDTIIPIWCDITIFLAISALVFYLVRNRKRIILPTFVWIPSVLLLLFYTYVRIASAVWHMSVFPFILLLVALNVLRNVKWTWQTVTAALFFILCANIYTLGNGFYYPQQSIDMMGSSMSMGSDSPDSLLIGTTDAGYMGYFSPERHVVVNLDGVVNHRAFIHIKDGTFSEYLEEQDFDILRVSPERLEFFCRNSSGRM